MAQDALPALDQLPDVEAPRRADNQYSLKDRIVLLQKEKMLYKYKEKQDSCLGWTKHATLACTDRRIIIQRTERTCCITWHRTEKNYLFRDVVDVSLGTNRPYKWFLGACVALLLALLLIPAGAALHGNTRVIAIGLGVVCLFAGIGMVVWAIVQALKPLTAVAIAISKAKGETRKQPETAEYSAKAYMPLWLQSLFASYTIEIVELPPAQAYQAMHTILTHPDCHLSQVMDSAAAALEAGNILE